MSELRKALISADDTPSIDPFARLRVSNPFTLFDSKQVNTTQPLFWDDVEQTGSGTSTSYSQNRASTIIGVSNTTPGYRIRQTYQRMNYQPGKGQLVLMTGILNKSGGGTGIRQAFGMFNDNNGIFVSNDQGEIKLVRRTYATGSPIDNEVAQASWNLDTMNGSGNSGITLDFTKTQILIIDFEWLGVGRVRVGWVIDGIPVYCHEFNNANNLDVVYMSTPNLPLRYEIENDGTGGAATLEHICASVMSEGGQQEIGPTSTISNGVTAVNAALTSAKYPLVAIRLNSSYPSGAIRLSRLSVLTATNKNILWSLHLNPTLSAPITYGALSNSVVEGGVGSGQTITANGKILDSGYAVQQSQSTISIQNAIQPGFAVDGTPDVLVLAIQPLATNASAYGSLTWREL